MSENKSSNNNRIAKNTIYLFVRSGVTLLVSLYTSRVVLQSLGVVDYGIYNVVGSIITMVTFLNSSLLVCFQRYFNVEMASGDAESLKAWFHSAQAIQFLLAILIVLISETLGLWFLNEKMVIPNDRMFAANCIYQASIISFILVIFQAPYSAMVTAYERMHIFAIISMVDSFLRLVIALLLFILPGDKLIWYAFLLCVISIINFLWYTIYNKISFNLGSIRFNWDRKILKQLLGFTSWGIVDSLSYTFMNTGVNLLLNVFFGPVVNAARGIAMQVSNAVQQFVNNVQIASRPAITKSYASCDYEYMNSLVFSTSKYTFYLLLLLTFPILFESNFILQVWLGENVPGDTVLFTRLILLIAWVGSFANALSGLAYATGNIKKFSLVVNGINMLILPFSYVALKLGADAEFTMIITLVVALIVHFARMKIVSTLTAFSPLYYLKKVILPSLAVTAISSVPIWSVILLLEEGLMRFLITLTTSSISVLLVGYLVGMNAFERLWIKNKVKTFINKIRVV